jgi:hypothetical protein
MGEGAGWAPKLVCALWGRENCVPLQAIELPALNLVINPTGYAGSDTIFFLFRVALTLEHGASVKHFVSLVS